jgi:DNA polymerase III subunit epsilon
MGVWTMEFVAIDFETANPSYASICQIGFAHYLGSALIDEWKSYVDPEDYFHPMNVRVHGIDFPMVQGAPRLPDLHSDIMRWLAARVVVSHTAFDRVALQQALGKYGLPVPDCRWLDSSLVARRTWTECAYAGYGLASVCRLIGHDFAHHDALEDAKAAGQVVIAACADSGFSVTDWLARIRRPITQTSLSRYAQRTQREGNPEGPLFGEVVVFTGALSIPRATAADLAAALGCEVARGVNKRTTMLVVGDQDVARLAGHELSSKHRRAEELAVEGQAIQILRESDFSALVAVHEPVVRS